MLALLQLITDNLIHVCDAGPFMCCMQGTLYVFVKLSAAVFHAIPLGTDSPYTVCSR